MTGCWLGTCARHVGMCPSIRRYASIALSKSAGAIRCSGPLQRLRRPSAARTFLGRTARVRVPPSAAAHSACAWAPLHHHHRRHRLADRGRGLGLVDYCEKSKTFRMMPRSKTSSAWCVSCVGVLSGTGARGRECKRADPHPLNLELDPRSWSPIVCA